MKRKRTGIILAEVLILIIIVLVIFLFKNSSDKKDKGGDIASVKSGDLIIPTLSPAGDTKENGQDTKREAQTANQEGQAANQEGQAANQEGQTANQEAQVSNLNITYVNSETERNPELEKAIIKAIDFPGPEDIKATRYYYNYIDLNDDGIDEVFTELVGPYTSGSGGDTGLIFTLSDDGFKLMQQLTLIRNPIIISDDMTNGWHDLIITQSGGGYPSQMVRMKYDGSRYPNPSDAEPVPADTVISGTGIIADDIAADFQNGKGLYLTPEQ